MKTTLRVAAAVLCTWLPSPARAQTVDPVVTLPAELRAAPGRLLKLTAATEGEQVRWAIASPEADLVPFPGTKTALFCSPKAGRYIVLAWTAKGNVPSEAARCVVTVGDDPPVDSLAADLAKLFATESSAEKRTHLAQLAALYREAVAYADNPAVRTAGDLAGRLRNAASSLLPRDALLTIRQRIAEEIAKQLPLDGEKPLDATLRRTAAQLFERIATSLEVLK